MNTISSLQHPLVKHLVKLRQNKDYRYDHQTLVVEGIKPIREHDPLQIKCCLCTENSLHALPQTKSPCYITSDEIIKKISGMLSSEGIIAEVSMPPINKLPKVHSLLVLDGIADPGNLGTLLRTALALGWEAAFVTSHSCDPFNEKAIRAARGATFRLPLAMGTPEDLQQLITKNNLTPYIADIRGTSIEGLTRSTAPALILGNEAHGPSADLKSIGTPVTIPMKESVESLNVSSAGAILMYQLGHHGRT